MIQDNKSFEEPCQKETKTRYMSRTGIRFSLFPSFSLCNAVPLLLLKIILLVKIKGADNVCEDQNP